MFVLLILLYTLIANGFIVPTIILVLAWIGLFGKIMLTVLKTVIDFVDK